MDRYDNRGEPGGADEECGLGQTRFESRFVGSACILVVLAPNDVRAVGRAVWERTLFDDWGQALQTSIWAGFRWNINETMTTGPD